MDEDGRGTLYGRSGLSTDDVCSNWTGSSVSISSAPEGAFDSATVSPELGVRFTWDVFGVRLVGVIVRGPFVGLELVRDTSFEDEADDSVGTLDREIAKEPGADGVTYRIKEAIARNKPRAGRVIENRGRSWHAPEKRQSQCELPLQLRWTTDHRRLADGRSWDHIGPQFPLKKARGLLRLP